MSIVLGRKGAYISFGERRAYRPYGHFVGLRQVDPHGTLSRRLALQIVQALPYSGCFQFQACLCGPHYWYVLYHHAIFLLNILYARLPVVTVITKSGHRLPQMMEKFASLR